MRGLFAGFGTTALRDAPFAGIYVFFYENLKGIISESTAMARTSVNLSSGIFGGLAATFLTHPFDVLVFNVR
jgi:solute carrier family 25, member 38